MKVIDLLNKIANGEEVPKKIRYEGRDMFWCEPCKIYEVDVEQNELCGTDLYSILDNLNDEIEIIEEDKKIEHKKNYFDFAISSDDVKFSYLYKMETRIIDKINSMEDKRER